MASKPQWQHRLCHHISSLPSPTNLYEFLGISTHKGIHRMLYMSGVDGWLIDGGAADYDKLSALMDVIHLWTGHPYAYAISSLVQTFCHAPLPVSAQSLAQLWQETAQLLRQDNTAATSLYHQLSSPYKVCDISQQADITPWIFPTNPTTQQEPLAVISSLVDQMTSALDPSCGVCRLSLAQLQQFERPHPYKSGMAYLKQSQGNTLSPTESSHLACQMIREFGQYAKTHNIQMEIHHLSPALYPPLFTYLATCQANAEVVCVAYTPEDAVTFAQSGAKVRLSLPVCMTHHQFCQWLETLAHGMPLGCLEGFDMSIEGIVDIPLAKRLMTWFDEWVNLNA